MASTAAWLRLVRAFDENPRAAHAGVRVEFLRGARLPAPGLAHQHHEVAVAGERAVEGAPQPLQLRLPPHEDSLRQPVERVRTAVGVGRSPAKRSGWRGVVGVEAARASAEGTGDAPPWPDRSRPRR